MRDILFLETGSAGVPSIRNHLIVRDLLQYASRTASTLEQELGGSSPELIRFAVAHAHYPHVVWLYRPHLTAHGCLLLPCVVSFAPASFFEWRNSNRNDKCLNLS
jgi:hypothetical protein